MRKSEIKEFFEILQKEIPNPTTELVYNSTFELLIAVILSAQATDISVNKATKELFKVANKPKTMFDLGQEKLENYIKTIGLYKTKAKNVLATCKILFEEFNSEVPNNREDLEKLPGVGRKTANVILNTAFQQPFIAVDTHIFRVANRLNLANGKDVLEVENKLYKNVPKMFLQDAHHLLILFGRYTCKAKKPACAKCFVQHLCNYKEKNYEN